MDDADESRPTGAARPETDGSEGSPEPEDDVRRLAEDWIAIWQSEITAYLTDPETQQAWGAMMALWAGAAQAMMRGVPAAPRRHERRRERPPAAPPAQRSGPDAAPGPAPAAAAPVARDDEIRRLEQRVAELERGLAERDRRRGTAGEDRRPRRTVRPRS